MVRALTSHRCGLGSILARYFTWVEFVVDSRLAPRVFLRILRFSFLRENQRSKFQFDQDRGPALKPAKDDVGFSLNIVIYFNLFLFLRCGDRAKWCEKFSSVEFDPISNCRIVSTAAHANCLRYNKEMNQFSLRVHQFAYCPCNMGPIVNTKGLLPAVLELAILGFYLKNRVFLTRNYRVIVAPRKFDVLETNICLRSYASRANMLVLWTSNFQGATIRPIVPRHKYSIVFIVQH